MVTLWAELFQTFHRLASNHSYEATICLLHYLYLCYCSLSVSYSLCDCVSKVFLGLFFLSLIISFLSYFFMYMSHYLCQSLTLSFSLYVHRPISHSAHIFITWETQVLKWVLVPPSPKTLSPPQKKPSLKSFFV